MQRAFALILVAAACGSNPKPSTVPLPPDPKPETTADTKPPEPTKEEPAKPVEPPAGPVDVTVHAQTVTVKLVSPGKGKRSPLKLMVKPGDKQQVEVSLDFSGKQAAPAELGGTQEDVAPTVVLTGAAEVKDVDKDGATKFELAIASADARDAPGQKNPSDPIREVLAAMKDLTIGGTIAANGVAGDLTMHLGKADGKAKLVLDLVRTESMPAWPVMPKEPIGVGAKWQVVANTRVVDKVDVTQTTDYELVKHDGNTWTIKGTTKVSGADQDVHGELPTKLSKITGTGTVEVAMVDGALYPTLTSQISTAFMVTVDTPADAPPNAPKQVSIQYDLKQGTKVTPKP